VVAKRRLRAARANRVFHAEVKRVRVENTVTGENPAGLGLSSYEIAANARTRFTSAHWR
jgi:hypothetical protein